MGGKAEQYLQHVEQYLGASAAGFKLNVFRWLYNICSTCSTYGNLITRFLK